MQKQRTKTRLSHCSVVERVYGEGPCWVCWWRAWSALRGLRRMDRLDARYQVTGEDSDSCQRSERNANERMMRPWADHRLGHRLDQQMRDRHKRLDHWDDQ